MSKERYQNREIIKYREIRKGYLYLYIVKATNVVCSFNKGNIIKYLVDPASSHMLVSKIKPCMSKHMP